MSKLSERLRLMAGWHEMAGFAERQADLIAAAEELERAEWKTIEPEKMDLEQGVVCAEWNEHRGWFVCPQMMTPGYAARRGYTHYCTLPAPPEVKA